MLEVKEKVSSPSQNVSSCVVRRNANRYCRYRCSPQAGSARAVLTGADPTLLSKQSPNKMQPLVHKFVDLNTTKHLAISHKVGDGPRVASCFLLKRVKSLSSGSTSTATES